MKLIPIKFILLQHQLFNPQFIYQIVKDHYKKNSEFKYLKQTQENKLYCQLLKNINNQLKKNIDVLRR